MGEPDMDEERSVAIMACLYQELQAFHKAVKEGKA
jgi:hypothetical protein